MRRRARRPRPRAGSPNAARPTRPVQIGRPVPDGRSRPDQPDPSDPASPGVAEVTASVVIRAPAERVFAAFLAWDRQGEWIPFTTVRVVSGDGGVGSMIEAVTAVGPAVLRDEM